MEKRGSFYNWSQNLLEIRPCKKFWSMVPVCRILFDISSRIAEWNSSGISSEIRGSVTHNRRSEAKPLVSVQNLSHVLTYVVRDGERGRRSAAMTENTVRMSGSALARALSQRWDGKIDVPPVRRTRTTGQENVNVWTAGCPSTVFSVVSSIRSVGHSAWTTSAVSVFLYAASYCLFPERHACIRGACRPRAYTFYPTFVAKSRTSFLGTFVASYSSLPLSEARTGRIHRCDPISVAWQNEASWTQTERSPRVNALARYPRRF